MNILGIFDGKNILITGGTGSFGHAFVEYLLKESKPNKVIIFSRDEAKQQIMKLHYHQYPSMRWFLGDMRDRDRLRRALFGVHYVIHAAALKQVDTGEYNPREFVLTNVFGSQNLIDASIDAGVEKVIALSTDKASSPINLYGATKLTSDKLFTAGNVYGASSGTKFSVVRYGNVIGSRGSVIPLFKKLHAEHKPIPLTDERMTRFWITLEQACDFVKDSFTDMHGGEIFIPKIPSMKVIDLIKAIAPDSKILTIGIRPGEKLHEEMISSDDSRRATIQNKRFIISPISPEWEFPTPEGKVAPEGFSYSSDKNDEWLDIDAIKRLINS